MEFRTCVAISGLPFLTLGLTFGELTEVAFVLEGDDDIVIDGPPDCLCRL